MYMGAVPIVKRAPHNSGFSSLPMLLVDDWREATDAVLDAAHARLAARPESADEPLYFPYWEERIRDDVRGL